MTPKIRTFLAEQCPATPCLVVDLDVVAESFGRIRRSLPKARTCYAVKANPAREVLETLVKLGSHFDAASVHEIDMCLAAGAEPAAIAYGNPIKKQGEIEEAFAKGIGLFAFDSEAELDKLATAAPGSQVFCRILTSSEGADWPLSRKFGCEPEMARNFMLLARERNLDAYGVSFHVGSQQTDPKQWEIAIRRSAKLMTSLREAGLDVRMLNLGGGFPVRYRRNVPDLETIAGVISSALTEHFDEVPPDIIIEPGRAVAAEAGVIQTEVVLIANKDYENGARWVYLDIGKFGGLAETMEEAIQYSIVTPRDGDPSGVVVIAGPTCDGADILYEKAGYQLPLSLKVGDKLHLLSTGAYTTTYASIGFNGIPPLAAYCI